MSSQTAIKASLIRGGTSKGLVLSRRGPAGRRQRRVTRCCSPRWARPTCARSTAWVVVIPSPPRSPSFVPRDVTTRTSTTSSCRCGPTAPRYPTIRTAGTCSRASGPSRSSRASFTATGDVTRGTNLDGEHQSLAVARHSNADGEVRYDGDARIDGVPGFAAPIPIEFLDIAGSTCGSLLPTGHVRRRRQWRRG